MYARPHAPGLLRRGFEGEQAGQVSAEPAVSADGAGITAFRGTMFLQPAPLLNWTVRVRHDAVAVTVMHFMEGNSLEAT
jgi:hypothetical protein